MNIHLNKIVLPQTVAHILESKFDFTDAELEFINGANQFLKAHAGIENYKVKQVYCIGTCLFNFTRIGLYFLLEDEVLTISTSNLKKINGEEPDWQVRHFPFKTIEALDLEMVENLNDHKYEAGILYVTVINDKGISRTHVLHNINPEHIHCFRDFYTNIMENKRIRGA
ncbi:hypothetical protein [Salinicoccus kekensis]|nr:hypothetical protein [Salinicoccus kekensis]